MEGRRQQNTCTANNDKQKSVEQIPEKTEQEEKWTYTDKSFLNFFSGTFLCQLLAHFFLPSAFLFLFFCSACWAIESRSSWSGIGVKDCFFSAGHETWVPQPASVTCVCAGPVASRSLSLTSDFFLTPLRSLLCFGC